MPNYRLISANSHVNEPPDLWVSRVDKKYRERAPQLMVNPPGKEGAYFFTRAMRRIRSGSALAPARARRN